MTVALDLRLGNPNRRQNDDAGADGVDGLEGSEGFDIRSKFEDMC